MLAKRLAGILLTFEEAVETTQINSVTGILKNGIALLESRPARRVNQLLPQLAGYCA